LELLAPLIVEYEEGGNIEFSLAGRPFNASMLTIVADWDMDEVCVEFYNFVTVVTLCWTGKPLGRYEPSTEPEHEARSGGCIREAQFGGTREAGPHLASCG
jgi:hypothetical protein